MVQANQPVEESVEAVDLGVPVGSAPMPVLLATDSNTLIAFCFSSGQAEQVAVVEFDRCLAAMLGEPNEDTLRGHRLYEKGLGYGANVVHHSAWLAEFNELARRTSVDFDELWWDAKFKHYVICFQDSTFQCIAAGFYVRTFAESMEEVLRRVIQDGYRLK
jgi:hypothetical protein